MFDNTIKFMREHKSEIYNYRGELLYLIDQIDFKNINPIINYIKKLGYDGVKYKSDKDYDMNKKLGYDGEDENINYWNYVIYNKNIIHPL